MHPGIKDQRGGEECKSFSSTRGKEREGALTVRPCRHHSFMLSTKSSVTNPQKDTSVWITTPQHDLYLVLTSSPPFHLRFLFAVYFLFISAHPACAFLFFFYSPPPPLLFPPPSSLAGLICHTSLTRPVPFVRPPLPPRSPSLSFITSASLFVSDELEGQASPPPHHPTTPHHPTPPPFCGLADVRHGWGLYIFF